MRGALSLIFGGCDLFFNDDSISSSSSGVDPEDVQAFIGNAGFSDETFAAISITISKPSSSTVIALAAYNVSGTVTYNSVSISLIGTFDAASGALSANGTGTVRSHTIEFSISGTYDDDDVADVSTYLGTFTETTDQNYEGVWNITFDRSSPAGVWYIQENGTYGYLTGSRDDNTGTITAGDTDRNVVAQNLKGTISGSGISGSWSNVEGGSGTWTGTIAN